MFQNVKSGLPISIEKAINGFIIRVNEQAKVVTSFAELVVELAVIYDVQPNTQLLESAKYAQT